MLFEDELLLFLMGRIMTIVNFQLSLLRVSSHYRQKEARN